ncbi:MAG: hypothetical protein FGF50_02665 [Candidatus Brockarchaeota archaeon]|nr:hypothetical protein [Candidatus Brockarchaeota archaeon]
MTVFKDDAASECTTGAQTMIWKPGRRPTRSSRATLKSTDGVNWVRPLLSLFEFNGSKRNNIVWSGVGTHNFTPFRDTNPNCPREESYKALGVGDGGLYAFKSPDGVRWQLMSRRPVITKGVFDSQNLAF